MITFILASFLLCVASLLAAVNCNGKGPEAGLMGLFYSLICVVATAAFLASSCVYVGMLIG